MTTSTLTRPVTAILGALVITSGILGSLELLLTSVVPDQDATAVAASALLAGERAGASPEAVL